MFALKKLRAVLISTWCRRGLATIAANVTFAAGCAFPKCSTYMPAQVKAAVEAADIVVVCLGTGKPHIW